MYMIVHIKRGGAHCGGTNNFMFENVQLICIVLILKHTIPTDKSSQATNSLSSYAYYSQFSSITYILLAILYNKEIL